MDHAKLLVRNRDGVELLSNVCRHRQSIMLEGSGNIENIVCPLHRWTYDLKGALLGAPRFPETPCVKLDSTPLARWNGLLFAGPRDPGKDLADFGCSEDFDFSGYVLDRVEVTDYAVNWKTFMEVYLEVYHVDYLHAGLGNFADVDNFHVRYGERNSVQVVPAKNGFNAPGTPVYRKWQEACLRQLRGKTPKYGALWASYFPGLGFEWYPNVLVVSNLIPRSPGAHHQYRRNLLSRGNRALRTRFRRGAESRLHRDGPGGRRNLPAPRPRPAGAVGTGAG